ncbi:MAG: hypothetical protein HC844_04640 [Tabrizicola sp.]|nr:hypothetical protein [Tabrizicola sp.]
MGIELIIQLVAGLLGGNLAGAGLKNMSLGTAGNSIVGALGGGLGGVIMGMLGGGGADAAAAASGLDMTAIIQAVAGGGAGGAILTAVLGMAKKMMAK